MNLGPDELRREIDDTIEEIERIEAEVVELFAEIVGPEAAGLVAHYMEAHEQAPRVKPLLRPAAWQEPSTAPPATP